MIYSTLKEVYNVDSFEKKKKKKREDILEDEEEKPTQPLQSYRPTYSSQLSQTSPPGSPLSLQPSTNNVKSQEPYHPYYDKELEQYLFEPSVNEEIPHSMPAPMSTSMSTPKTTTHIPISPVLPPEQTQIIKATQQMHQEPIVHKYNYQDARDMYYKNLVNIGLFIFIGILIIFLCDQITEIAINLGMKRTVLLLEPYLTREKTEI